MTTYYKATRLDGTDFYTGTVDYAAKVGGGLVRVKAPKADRYECGTSGVLHAADVPTEALIGGKWPCRLFEVTGRPVAREGHKFGFRQLRVVREVDAHLALGPQGAEVAALVERARVLTFEEARQLDAAWGAAWVAARDAAWVAAWGAAWGAAWDAAWAAAWGAARGAAGAAARGAAWDAAWGAARGAARALVVRDLVGQHGYTQAHYDTLTGPWRQVIGPLHPDDAEVTR